MSSDESVRKAISEIDDRGYGVLRAHFPSHLVVACRDAFWPRLREYYAITVAGDAALKAKSKMP